MSMNNGPQVLEPPKVHKDADWHQTFEPQWQVILYNDEVHSFDEVVGMIQSVFNHPLEVAIKIVKEAHISSRAIADVLSKEEAVLKKQLAEKCTPPFTMGLEQISL